MDVNQVFLKEVHIQRVNNNRKKCMFMCVLLALCDTCLHVCAVLLIDVMQEAGELDVFFLPLQLPGLSGGMRYL